MKHSGSYVCASSLRFLGLCGCVLLLAHCGLQNDVVAADDDPVGDLSSELRALSGPEILGDLALGETKSVHHSGRPIYRAYRLQLDAQSVVALDVRSDIGDAKAWVLRDDFVTVAVNDNAGPGTTNALLAYSVPRSGTYYVAFREKRSLAATFTVTATAVRGGGVVDAGVADAGRADAGSPDAGSVDAGTRAIDWCGNGEDEDGDGRDRACRTARPQPAMVEVILRGDSTGELQFMPQCSGCTPALSPSVAHARIVLAQHGTTSVRFHNESSSIVRIEAAAPVPGDWWTALRPGDVVVETSDTLFPNRPYSAATPWNKVYFDTVNAAEGPAGPDASASLVGTMKDGSGNVTPVRLTLTPAQAPNCAPSSNTAWSMDECAGQEYCTVNMVDATVDTIPSPGGKPQHLIDFHQDDCKPHYGYHWNSRLSWTANDYGRRVFSYSGNYSITGGSETLWVATNLNRPGGVVEGKASGNVSSPWRLAGVTFELRWERR